MHIYADYFQVNLDLTTKGVTKNNWAYHKSDYDRLINTIIYGNSDDANESFAEIDKLLKNKIAIESIIANDMYYIKTLNNNIVPMSINCTYRTYAQQLYIKSILKYINNTILDSYKKYNHDRYLELLSLVNEVLTTFECEDITYKNIYAKLNERYENLKSEKYKELFDTSILSINDNIIDIFKMNCLVELNKFEEDIVMNQNYFTLDECYKTINEIKKVLRS